MASRSVEGHDGRLRDLSTPAFGGFAVLVLASVTRAVALGIISTRRAGAFYVLAGLVWIMVSLTGTLAG